MTKAGTEMHAGATGLFALLNKVNAEPDGTIRHVAMIAVTSVEDGEKLQAALELLKSGVEKWEVHS
jgi:hypothetical protein